METLAENRRARFDYEILDTLEAGVALTGSEVKSVKSGKLQLAGSYAHIRQEEAWLTNAVIPPYQPNNAPPGYDEDRSRRLLLHRDEIKSILGKLKDKSTVLIPLRAYTKHGLVKIALGVAKPRKKHDKREMLKKKSAEREMRAGK